MNKRSGHKSAALIVSACLILLAGCSDNDDNAEDADNSQSATDYAFAFTRAPAFDSAQIERINITDGYIVDGTYPATQTDYGLTTDQESLYQIGRFGINTLTKLSATDPTTFDFDLSILDAETADANPIALAFLDDDTAYLTQRSTDKILIIDPTPDTIPATRDSLVKGEISLADYNRETADGVNPPDMTGVVIVDNKLFVLMENLDGAFNNIPVNNGYVAVFDLTDHSEIDTGNDPVLKGIPLNTKNPTDLQVDETTGMIYVIGRGDVFRDAGFPRDVQASGVKFSGGIESINSATYEASLVVDDGTDDNNKGYFNRGVVVNDSLAYIISVEYNSTGSYDVSNTLRSVNLNTDGLADPLDAISDPIPGTDGRDLTTLNRGPDGNLWIGFIADTPGFLLLDLSTGDIAEQAVNTSLIPADLTFISVDSD